jgi:hypothetical protein
MTLDQEPGLGNGWRACRCPSCKAIGSPAAHASLQGSGKPAGWNWAAQVGVLALHLELASPAHVAPSSPSPPSSPQPTSTGRPAPCYTWRPSGGRCSTA